MNYQFKKRSISLALSGIAALLLGPWRRTRRRSGFLVAIHAGYPGG
jgi:hypothetical protein